MIYLTYNEYVERLVRAKRYTNKRPIDLNQTPAERSAEVLYIQLMYFLGTDRQEYYIESMLRYLKFSIKEKIHAQEFKNPNS